ncbi:hypothetical protein LXL04_035032 [Taraxacum kok-saghyz]
MIINYLYTKSRGHFLQCRTGPNLAPTHFHTDLQPVASSSLPVSSVFYRNQKTSRLHSIATSGPHSSIAASLNRESLKLHRRRPAPHLSPATSAFSPSPSGLRLLRFCADARRPQTRLICLVVHMVSSSYVNIPAKCLVKCQSDNLSNELC